MERTAEERDAMKAEAERLVRSAERALRKAVTRFRLAGCPTFSAKAQTLADAVMRYDENIGGAL